MCAWRVLWCVHKTAQDVGIASKYCSFIPILFGCFFRNGKREDRWEGSPMGRCMVCEVWKYRTMLLTKNKQCVVNSNDFKWNCKSNDQTSITEVETATLANYTCSVVWSPHIFMYNSPSNIYLMIHTFSLSVHYTTWPWLLQFSRSVPPASFLSQ